jgi:hypothetical protein
MIVSAAPKPAGIYAIANAGKSNEAKIKNRRQMGLTAVVSQLGPPDYRRQR